MKNFEKTLVGSLLALCCGDDPGMICSEARWERLLENTEPGAPAGALTFQTVLHAQQSPLSKNPHWIGLQRLRSQGQGEEVVLDLKRKQKTHQ